MAAKPRAKRNFTLVVPQFVTMALVHNLIDRAQPILEGSQFFGRFTVDASQLAHISPVGLAALTTIVLSAVRGGRFEKGFLVDPKKTHVRTYLSRMNFKRLLNVRERSRVHRAPRQARFRELIEVSTDDDCSRVTDQIATVLRKKGDVSELIVDNTVYCLLELLENIVHHAESPTNGLVCAQAYKESGAVELVIVDCGIGVRASLSKNPRYSIQSDADAIRLALQKGVTSTPARNSGEGLFFVAELMERAGRMRLHSGNAMVSVGKTGKVVRKAAEWPGTLVGLRFEKRSGIPIREIFNRFAPLSEELLLPFEELK